MFGDKSPPNYLRWEAEAIFKSVYKRCIDAIAGGEGEQQGGIVKAARGEWKPDSRADRAVLDIPLGEDLVAVLDRYAGQAKEASLVLNAAGI